MLPNNQIVHAARELAISAHGTQLYNGTEPYTVHLHEVVAVLYEFGFSGHGIIACGYLHDIVEDTDVLISEIMDVFGTDIGRVVWGVTNEPGANRAARHKATYPKLISNIHCIIVKLADRIANWRHCLKTGDAKVLMYRKEYLEFKKHLTSIHAGPVAMWAELDRLMEESKQWKRC